MADNNIEISSGTPEKVAYELTKLIITKVGLTSNSKKDEIIRLYKECLTAVKNPFD